MRQSSDTMVTKLRLMCEHFTQTDGANDDPPSSNRKEAIDIFRSMTTKYCFSPRFVDIENQGEEALLGRHVVVHETS